MPTVQNGVSHGPCEDNWFDRLGQVFLWQFNVRQPACPKGSGLRQVSPTAADEGHQNGRRVPHAKSRANKSAPARACCRGMIDVAVRPRIRPTPQADTTCWIIVGLWRADRWRHRECGPRTVRFADLMVRTGRAAWSSRRNRSSTNHPVRPTSDYRADRASAVRRAALRLSHRHRRSAVS